jgi:hypothetical protein
MGIEEDGNDVNERGFTVHRFLILFHFVPVYSKHSNVIFFSYHDK